MGIAVVDHDLRDRVVALESEQSNFNQSLFTTANGLTTALGQVSGNLADHEADTSNPHAVTAAQVGAYTTQQVDTALAGKVNAAGLTTSGIAEGSNKYYTDARAAAAAPVQSVAGKTGVVAVASTDLTDAAAFWEAQGPGTAALSAIYNPTTGLSARALQSDLTAHTGNTSNPHAVTKAQVGLGNVANVDTTNAANITSGVFATARVPTLPYLPTTGVSVFSGSQFYFSKPPINIPNISLSRQTDGGYDYLDYQFYAYAPDGQIAVGEQEWDDSVGTIRVTLPAAITGYTYKLYRYDDNQGFTSLLGSWTAATLPAHFDDDLSIQSEDDSAPGTNYALTRALDNGANTLQLDGVSLSAASFHGNGAGLTNLSSPYNQTLNTTSSVQFGTVVVKGGTTAFGGPSSAIMSWKGQNGYPGYVATDLGNISNYGQFTLNSQLGQSFGTPGVKQSQFIFNQAFYQSGNYPISTLAIDFNPVSGYWGTGRICYLDLTQNGTTLFAIDRYGKLQWTTNAAEGLFRDTDGGTEIPWHERDTDDHSTGLRETVMSIFDAPPDTTTPAQKVAARIIENVRIAGQMLLQTYTVGYTDLWFSKTIDTHAKQVPLDPAEIAVALGANGAQAMSLTAVIGQLFGEGALTPIPAGYSYALNTTTGTLTLTYVDPDSSSSSSESSGVL